jgi:starch synthase
MANQDEALRILMVTPEVTFVPSEIGPDSCVIRARAGSLGDICATQVQALHQAGVQVHLAIPNYRHLFKANARRQADLDLHDPKPGIPLNRIHLAQDRSFFYHRRLFRTINWENIRMALAFQREVINRIIPEVEPHLIHCYDWMTGLIPPMARRNNIPSIFTLYRPDAPRLPLSVIEERGIDAASFWQNCYYARMPVNYQESRDTNPVDLLASGVFGAHVAQALSQTFLDELMDERRGPEGAALRSELRNKAQARGLAAVPPAPDPSFNPAIDRALMRPFAPHTHDAGKLFNKLHLQEKLNLRLSTDAPLCFWPTRLDGSRSGCRLMAETLETILERYRPLGLQVVFVADGDLQEHLRALVRRLNAAQRVALTDFDARICRLAYGAADFVLMPMHRDPCALPCKIGQRYGALPIAYDAGAVHDCTVHLEAAADRGSGFLFKHFDANGFLWAMDQAMAFYQLPPEQRASQVGRVMRESLVQFDPQHAALQAIALYERVLNRPLLHCKAAPEDSTVSKQAA